LVVGPTAVLDGSVSSGDLVSRGRDGWRVRAHDRLCSGACPDQCLRASVRSRPGLRRAVPPGSCGRPPQL